MRAPERLYLLDLTRGLAAIAVVVFHWQFWGSDGSRLEPAGGFGLLRAIGEAALAFFYSSGAAAVGLFFTLSGFVFFWLFAPPIREGLVGPWHFFVDRFSRLYPLHLLTLILVAIGQLLYSRMNRGVGWTSPVNSMSNFVAQILVVPLWTPVRAIEFNLPVWSLSVEALVYVVFFLVARRARPGLATAVCMVALGCLANGYSKDIAYGMTSFFMGGVTSIVYQRLPDSRFERPLALLVGASWILAIAFGAGLADQRPTPLHFLDHWFAIFVQFPATVLYFAMLETRRGPIARRWSWLGDATYAMYLLGFPLMLGIALAWRAAGRSFDELQSPLVMLVFLTPAIPISYACHRWFERPVQKALRRRLSMRRQQ